VINNINISHLPDESRRLLEKVVPPPFTPPLLYLAMADNPEVLRGFIERPILGLKGLLHTGQLTARDRELCILRVTAQTGADHEWGVHVAYFGKTSGLTQSQVQATAGNTSPEPAWTPRQLAIIAICDAAAGLRALTPEEKELTNTQLTPAELTEFIAVSSLYLGISAVCAVREIPGEPNAPRLPKSR